MRQLVRRLGYIVRWRRLERELAEEMESHRAMNCFLLTFDRSLAYSYRNSICRPQPETSREPTC